MFLFWKIMFRTIFGIGETCRFQNWYSFLFCKMGTFLKKLMPTMLKMYCNMQHSPSAYNQTVMQSYSHTVRQSYSHTVHCSVNTSRSRPWAALMCGITMCGRHLSTNERPAATSRPMRGDPGSNLGPGSNLNLSCELRVSEKEKELPARRCRSSGIQSRELRETLLTGQFSESNGDPGCVGREVEGRGYYCDSRLRNLYSTVQNRFSTCLPGKFLTDKRKLSLINIDTILVK